jgi:hypothetical protein
VYAGEQHGGAISQKKISKKKPNFSFYPNFPCIPGEHHGGAKVGDFKDAIVGDEDVGACNKKNLKIQRAYLLLY